MAGWILPVLGGHRHESMIVVQIRSNFRRLSYISLLRMATELTARFSLLLLSIISKASWMRFYKYASAQQRWVVEYCDLVAAVKRAAISIGFTKMYKYKQSMHQSSYPSIHQSIYSYTCPFIHSPINLSINRPIHPSISLSIYPYIYIYLSIYKSIYLSTYQW